MNPLGAGPRAALAAAVLVALTSLGAGVEAAPRLRTEWVETAAAPTHPSARRERRRSKSRMRDTVAGGTHWRLTTARGAIHVWRPKGYTPKTAGTLIYLHGYYTDVDQAWEQHRLAEQFRDSGRNALFIAVESPINNPDTVKWLDVATLFGALRAAAIAVPSGPVVVMAHSGGFRTVVPWLASGALDQVILLDALYNNVPEFDAWLKADPDRHRMILVGFETVRRTEQLLANYGDALIREALPERFSEFSREERRAKLLYLRSQYGHMEMVTEGLVIPMMLRLAPFAPL